MAKAALVINSGTGPPARTRTQLTVDEVTRTLSMLTSYKVANITMKPTHLAIIIAYITAISVQAQVTHEPAGDARHFTVIDRGANYRVWQRTVQVGSAGAGEVMLTNCYVELATGMHAQRNGKWVEASEEIELDTNGAVARKGAHKVHFASNINTAGGIDLTTPGGTRLRSRVLGLSYFERTTGRNVLIAELRDARGELLPSRTEVLYPQCLTDIKASLRYTYRRSGLEQDLILEERLPSPELFGLDPTNTRLQLLTEFFDTVPPGHRGLDAGILDFGDIQIGEGRAFMVDGQSGLGLLVEKSWQTIDGRSFLVEEIDYSSIEPELRNLPASDVETQEKPGSDQSAILRVSPKRVLPAVPGLSLQDSGPMPLAAAQPAIHGLVWDYNANLNGGSSLTLQSDTTYLLSGPVYPEDFAIFEGGAVLKYSTNAYLSLESCTNVQWKCGSYRPIVFTSQFDDSIGTLIAPGAIPPFRVPGSTYLKLNSLNSRSLTDNGVLHDLRMSYAAYGIQNSGTNEIRNCQFINCGYAIAGANSGYVHNVLFSQCDYCYFINAGSGTQPLELINVTADRGCNLIGLGVSYFTATANLFWSILTEVTNLNTVLNPGAVLGVNLNGSPNLSSRTGIYQAVGAGGFYVPADSPYRVSGPGNSGLAFLKSKTTYAPIEYNAARIHDTNQVLGVAACRDVDAPDYGFHYDPVDYLCNSVEITNATVRLDAGVAVATYATSIGASAGSGIVLNTGGNLNSLGKAGHRNYIVRYNMVQEGSLLPLETWPNGDASYRTILSTGLNGGSITNCFTDIIAPGGGVILADIANAYCILSDCNFQGGTVMFESAGTFPGVHIYAARCTFQRDYLEMVGFGSLDSLEFRNSLFYQAQIPLFFLRGAPKVTFKDNLFDRDSLYFYATTNTFYDHNAYLAGYDRLLPTNATDVVLNSITYDRGPLGDFYLRPGSPLIDAGSTNAEALGMSHYTVLTNQVAEDQTTLDIGVHYVSLISPPPLSLNVSSPSSDVVYILSSPTNVMLDVAPLDSVGFITNVSFLIGTTNLGQVTAAPWQLMWSNVAPGSYNIAVTASDDIGLSGVTNTSFLVDVLPSITIHQPLNLQSFAQPTDISISAMASDPDGVVTEVKFFAGTLLLGTRTNSPYTLIWSNAVLGTYDLTAVATDNAGGAVTSSVATITISNSQPIVSLTSPVNGTCLGAPATIGISAEASDANGSVAKVEFYNNATNKISETTSAPFVATWSNIGVGFYSLTAKATDNLGASSSSAAVNISITNPPPLVTLITPTNNATFAAPATISLGAMATDLNGSVAKVEFFSNTTNKIAEASVVPFTVTWNDVAVGVYSITAKATDDLGASSTSSAVSVIVSNPPPTVTLTWPTNNSLFFSPALIQLTASAADSDGSVSKVEFFNGISKLGEATSNPFTLTWNNVSPGIYSITAKATDNLGLSTTSAPISLSVEAPPVVSITAPANDSSFVTPTNLSISVSASDSDGSVSRVEFYDGLDLIGAITNSPYNLVWSNAPMGAHFLTARAIDNQGGATRSVPILIMVTTPLLPVEDAYVEDASPNGKYGTATTLKVQAGATGNNRQSFLKFNVSSVTNFNTATLRIYASLSGSGNVTATAHSVGDTNWSEKTITWNSKPAVGPSLGSATISGTAYGWYQLDVTSYVTAQKAAGQRFITLALTNSSSSSVFVQANSKEASANQSQLMLGRTNQSPSLTLTAPANNSIFVAPADLSLAASASDVDGSIHQVEFFENDISLGIDTSNPYSLNWNNVSSGTYALTARATDNQGFVYTSGVVNVTVDHPPTVSLVTPPNNAVLPGPATITLTAIATDPDGFVSSVEFFDGTMSLGVKTDPPYSLCWSNVGMGTYSVTARATDNVGIISTSTPVTVVVEAPPVVSLISPVDGADVSAPASITLSATAVDNDGTITQVEFFDGSIRLGTLTAAPFSMIWSNVPAGTYNITARATDNLGLIATSSVSSLRVNATFLPVKPMMAIGQDFGMNLLSNGTIVTWGGNEFGQLGDFTFLESSAPVSVVGISNVVSIASGSFHGLAIDWTGSLWSWGWNAEGQLGNGTNQAQNIPSLVIGMTNTVAAAANYDFSLAANADGSVWIWGYPYGASGYILQPRQVGGVSNAVSVAAGWNHSLALVGDGTVWGWGKNESGQLGNGDRTGAPQLTPGKVSGLTNIAAICSRGDHNLALESNGVVWAWGYNGDGESGIGDNSYTNTLLPVRVLGLTNVTGLAAGVYHSMAVDTNGNVFVWGANDSGQLGVGSQLYYTDQPTYLSSLSNICVVAGNFYSSAALDTNGTIRWWGDWFGAAGTNTASPAMVPQYFDNYRGQIPQLDLVSGNSQIARLYHEFAVPLVFQVRDINGAVLSNAPVSIEVVSGGISLRTQTGGKNLSGLRATTDANGQVSLIGYAKNTLGTNCLVKVLAAAGAKYARLDFTETISVILPTVSIAWPTNGASLISPALWVTVNAHEVGGTIQRVVLWDSTQKYWKSLAQSPFTFEWTNVPDGTYTISAYAEDDSGVPAYSSPATFTFVRDTDGNGLPDAWQIRYFGHIGVEPNADSDGDGLSNLQEYQLRTDPIDFYNGVLPGLVIGGGNGQQGTPGTFLPVPISVLVTTGTNASPLGNAPLLLTAQGSALLAASTNDSPTTTLSVRTEVDGHAAAWVYIPFGAAGLENTIVVQAWSGTNSVAVEFTEPIPGRLAYWAFNTSDWIGEAGQTPLAFTNLVSIPDWSGNAVRVDSANLAYLCYRDIEPDGVANINVRCGTLRFWFKPDWNSRNTNNGSGPGVEGRLFEMGSRDSDGGWWALVTSADGTTLSFITQSGNASVTNLTATISWTSNDWHQIAVTYNSQVSAIYLDGVALLTNGLGVNHYPGPTERAKGFRIGSDANGNLQMRGQFDELETFSYPLSAGEVVTACNLARPVQLVRPAMTLDQTNNGLAAQVTVQQAQNGRIFSSVTGLQYPNPGTWVVTAKYADCFFARNSGGLDSPTQGINISKLPNVVITPGGASFNYPSNVTLSLAAESLTDLVTGLYQAELGRTPSTAEAQSTCAYAQALREQGYSDEDVRTNLINGTYFRGSSEYLLRNGSPGEVYSKNDSCVIQYSRDGGLIWIDYSGPIEITNSLSLQARASKSASLDGRTLYAYLTSDIASADFSFVPSDWLSQYFGPDWTGNPNSPLDADSDHDGLNNLQEYQLGTDPIHPDTDYDGCNDGDESIAETDAMDASSVPDLRLGYWRFNTVNCVGEYGQVPLACSNVVTIPDWSFTAVQLDSIDPIYLAYRDLEENGEPNINLQNGSVRFWFKADWNSASTNNGSGPGSEGRLIELGARDSANGWWALTVSADGTSLSFVTQTNGAGQTNLTATVNWTSNDWHQVALSYSPLVSSIYLDGQPVITNGLGIVHYPGAAERARGLRIGAAADGNNQARGLFDELETFNYTLRPDLILGNYNAVLVDPDGEGTSDYIHFIQGRNPLVERTVADTNNLIDLRVYTPLRAPGPVCP